MLVRSSRSLARVAAFAKPCSHHFMAGQGLRHASNTATSDLPLRILFCGSDEFSIKSLEAVHQYSKGSDSNVASIDVATKTDKRTGRGLKIIKPPPIKPVAEKLGLALHQFDTFRGWNLPNDSGQSYINMIIAVSFGLLVPPRVLNACRYGGLNVHPSMLPDLKGSSPLEHTIINGYRRTGVSIQTLHPSRFDEGQIVSQTPAPGLDIPEPDAITSKQLRDLLAPIGAEMLVKCLRDRLYLKPEEQQSPSNTDADARYAPKLSPEARHISFRNMEAEHILRLDRALGRLWVNMKTKDTDTRVIFEPGMRLANEHELKGITTSVLDDIPIGLPFAATKVNERIGEACTNLLVKCACGKYLCIPDLRASGLGPGRSIAVAAKARCFEGPVAAGNDHELRQFEAFPS